MGKRALGFILVLFTFLMGNHPTVGAGSFIVEVEDPTVIATIQETMPELEINHRYDTLFHGFSATGSEQSVEKLKAMAGVKRVMRNVSYKVSLDESVKFIGGDALRNARNEGTSITGEGIKVGIIDTGVDYTHPDLKENYKGGYDVVDSDDDPMETEAEQGEPTLHGTHVSGIIGANGKVKGVAPEAELYGYRALGPGGIGTSEQVIAAIEKAVEDGMDVINLSLGNSVNGPDWPTSIALNKAVEKGVVCVTSSGNSGPGLWTVGSPGTASKAISVGASAPPLEIPFIKVGLDDVKIPIHPMQGSIPWPKSFIMHDYELVDGGIGRPAEIKESRNKVVLIERGTLTFTEKARNAAAKDAKAVLIFNNEKGPFSGSLEQKLNIPVFSISQEDGLFLKEQLVKGTTWMETQMHQIKDRMAAFSSRGPVTHSWEIKPDVSAPGVDIKSTVPNGYLALQGTSMAAPHVAGAAALILQAHPNWTPYQVKAALMNTSIRLKDEKGELYLPFEQGAGRIQVDDAVKAETLVYPGALSFGEFLYEEKRTKREISITVDNQSNESKTYYFDYPKRDQGIQWEVPHSFTLKPKEKRIVKVSVDIQPEMREQGIHQGYLVLSENGDPIHLPYLYVIENTDYPRIMGFSFAKEKDTENYKYEFYLPEKAEEVGIALYEPDSLRYVGMLYHEQNVNRGVHETLIPVKEIGFPNGVYKTIVYAKAEGKEEKVESMIYIGEQEPMEKKNINTIR